MGKVAVPLSPKRAGANGSPDFAVNGAAVICTHGERESKFTPTETADDIGGRRVGIASNTTSNDITPTFGLCSARPDEDLPSGFEQCNLADFVDEWFGPSENISFGPFGDIDEDYRTELGNTNALSIYSCLICTHGGVVSFVSSGQNEGFQEYLDNFTMYDMYIRYLLDKAVRDGHAIYENGYYTFKDTFEYFDKETGQMRRFEMGYVEVDGAMRCFLWDAGGQLMSTPFGLFYPNPLETAGSWSDHQYLHYSYRSSDLPAEYESLVGYMQEYTDWFTNASNCKDYSRAVLDYIGPKLVDAGVIDPSVPWDYMDYAALARLYSGSYGLSYLAGEIEAHADMLSTTYPSQPGGRNNIDLLFTVFCLKNNVSGQEAIDAFYKSAEIADMSSEASVGVWNALEKFYYDLFWGVF